MQVMMLGKLDIHNGDKGELKLTTKMNADSRGLERAVVVILDELKIGRYYLDRLERHSLPYNFNE